MNTRLIIIKPYNNKGLIHERFDVACALNLTTNHLLWSTLTLNTKLISYKINIFRDDVVNYHPQRFSLLIHTRFVKYLHVCTLSI